MAKFKQRVGLTMILFGLGAWTPVQTLALADDLFASDDPSAWSDYATSLNHQFDEHEKSELETWKKRKLEVATHWGKETKMPEAKRFVQYGDNDHTRIRIDYESGEVEAEILVDSDGKTLPAEIGEKLMAIVTSEISNNPVPNAILMPGEIGQALIQRPTPSSELVRGADGKDRRVFRLSFKLAPDHIKTRAKAVLPFVQKWSEKYGLDPSFVLAVIRQESSFNPRARSWVPAYGLMQIVPKYAGQEVMKALTGVNTTPDAELLYLPEKNIMIGATYLQLLRDQYFPEVQDLEKRTYLMTAAYNWGPHRIKSAIAKGKIPASATASETFDILQRIAPEETKKYVRKVTQYAVEFRNENHE